LPEFLGSSSHSPLLRSSASLILFVSVLVSGRKRQLQLLFLLVPVWVQFIQQQPLLLGDTSVVLTLRLCPRKRKRTSAFRIDEPVPDWGPTSPSTLCTQHGQFTVQLKRTPSVHMSKGTHREVWRLKNSLEVEKNDVLSEMLVHRLKDSLKKGHS
jgi:hypothetical protein